MLILKNVSYHYSNSKKNVLKNINTKFEQGKLYAITGKSGSGKTTLLSLISGLDKVSDGEILNNEKSLAQLDMDQYRAKSVGVIFQGYNLITTAKAWENIVLSMNISGIEQKDKKETVYRLLEQVGIDNETAERKVLKLSGGEQQRVGIARALSHNPDLVIADEPTGNLDGETEKDIMDIFANLAHKENKCVIIVTHSKKVSGYADVVLSIKDGSISE